MDRNTAAVPSRVALPVSLSARRAWIEIGKSPPAYHHGKSLSARRAWIEIAFFDFQIHVPPNVALRKESVDRNALSDSLPALKLMSLSARRAWIEIFSVHEVFANFEVALRKESVDRNK